jgi:hypothetical protein
MLINSVMKEDLRNTNQRPQKGPAIQRRDRRVQPLWALIFSTYHVQAARVINRFLFCTLTKEECSEKSTKQFVRRGSIASSKCPK